ncbi:ubiquitin-like modifier hub1 [Stylosanthes scabra]|uniref:E3 ubiquitin protein ligase n=1 Tax=Stylosanthes scabra TaxID=79078 RepID=A0ABU6QJF0_9FABA|nr:ubiquitin-like modifier hub1 [Stylosanthes scabra]
MSELSVVLTSKNGENEAYLSEIESIGQAYDEKQTQNQHMLQQITERDDYNIKLVLEGVRARQKQDSLVMEKRVMQQEIQQANVTRNLYDSKAARIEDQLKFCSDQIQRLIEDKMQKVQSKAGSSRVTCMESHVELEKERFSKKRLEEELEVSRRKLSCLKAQNEGCLVIEKLQEELAEYREIVKCSICQDRTKEVVITKCYHLFCGTCIQKVSGSRHRKCPQCSTSFGANDVKPVYLNGVYAQQLLRNIGMDYRVPVQFCVLCVVLFKPWFCQFEQMICGTSIGYDYMDMVPPGTVKLNRHEPIRQKLFQFHQYNNNRTLTIRIPLHMSSHFLSPSATTVSDAFRYLLDLSFSDMKNTSPKTWR